ncbi:MAG: hypothetical protein IJU31_00970 [Synergistaceae bacterium]|nr:hypothetical protein [Synergistaceae bacterium]
MPDDLDPTTARLVSELAASILPTLSKSVNSAIHAEDFISAIDRTNMISQDLRNQIEKSIRSGIDDNRAARSMMMQSMRNVFDEISSVKKVLDKIPDMIDSSVKNNTPEDNANPEILQELASLSERVSELSKGIKTFFEVYAQNQEDRQQSNNVRIESGLDENSTRLEKLLNSSLPGLEGLVKAHEKAQSRELEEFSKEISTLHRENDKTIIFQIKEAISNELDRHSEEIIARIEEDLEAKSAKNFLFMKIIAGISAASLILSLIGIFI